MNTLEILGQTGHTTVEWDPANETEVATAKAEFEKLRDAGFLLFVVEEVSAFPEGAGRLEARLVSGPPAVAATAPEPGVDLPAKRPGRPRRGAQTREFDPKAKRTVAVRPMRGG